MNEWRIRRPFRVAALVLATLPAAGMARAADAPLIWTPVQTSDTSYAMRMGSYLPTELEASAGAEVSFADRKAGGRIGNPVKFWSSVELPASRRKGRTSAKLDLNLDAATGNRSASLSRSRSFDLSPEISARIEDLYSVNYDRGAAKQVGASATSTVRLTSRSTSTSLVARGTRSSRDQEWQASVGVEQKVSKSLNFSANVDNLAASRPSGTIRAGYSHKW